MLTNVSLDQLKTLARKGHLPFNRSGDGWSEFALRDALDMVIMRRLMEQGREAISARALVREGKDKLDELMPLVAAGSQLQIWFGHFSLVTYGEDLDEPDAALTTTVVGTLDDVARTLHEAPAIGEGPAVVEKVSLVNVTALYQRLIQRAQLGGVLLQGRGDEGPRSSGKRRG